MRLVFQTKNAFSFLRRIAWAWKGNLCFFEGDKKIMSTETFYDESQNWTSVCFQVSLEVYYFIFSWILIFILYQFMRL